LTSRRRRRPFGIITSRSRTTLPTPAGKFKDAIAMSLKGINVYAKVPYLEFLGYDDIDELMFPR